ncbi:MAG: hypothetical protein V4478_03500 [Patescibacteria group bacterium]
MKEISYLKFLSLESKIRGILESACEKVKDCTTRFYSLSDNTMSALYSSNKESINFDKDHGAGSYLIFKAFLEQAGTETIEIEILADGRMDFCVTAMLPAFLRDDSYDEIEVFDDGGRKLNLLEVDFADIDLAIDNVLFIAQLKEAPNSTNDLKDAIAELNKFKKEYLV